MATRIKQEHWITAMLFAVIWPVKVVFFYFLDCFKDIAKEVKEEWGSRKRYTGWER